MYFDTTIAREIKASALMCHCSSFVENKEGRLICVWYEGAYETSPDTVIKLSYKDPEDSEWQESKVLFRFPNVPLGNPVLFSLDGSKIFLIFSLLMRESWKDSILCISVSEDGGQTWSHPSILLPQKGFMGKTQPIQLQSGKIIIPIYNEEEFCPYVIILDDMQNLQNRDKLPVGVFLGCLCGDFNATDSPIAWEFIGYENGGTIASFACTSGAQYIISSLCSESLHGHIGLGVFKSYAQGNDISGKLWDESIRAYLNDEKALELGDAFSMLNWNNALSNHYVIEQWTLFGDPTLKIGGYS